MAKRRRYDEDAHFQSLLDRCADSDGLDAYWLKVLIIDLLVLVERNGDDWLLRPQRNRFDGLLQRFRFSSEPDLRETVAVLAARLPAERAQRRVEREQRREQRKGA